MFRRIKNLWYLSGLYKGEKGYPNEYERGHQAGEMHALGERKMAQIITLDDELKDFPKETTV